MHSFAHPLNSPIDAEAAVLSQSINASASIQTRANGCAVVDVVLAFASRVSSWTHTGVVAPCVETGGAVFARVGSSVSALVNVFVAVASSPTDRTDALVVL